MIPLMLDLRGKRVVIFGGGSVGLRKAAFFAGRTEVEVVSRTFDPGFDQVPVRRRTLDLDISDPAPVEELLEGSFLAVGATSDPSLNDHIGEICREKSILFNNATGSRGDVLVPSVVRGDRYCIAISTMGDSPAVPRFVREYLQEHLPDLDRMIQLQHDLRDRLQESGLSASRRREILHAVIRDPDVWHRLSIDGEDARTLATQRYVHE